MISRVSRLPSRFPLGTRYVIEGCGGRIYSRYLEFPDGRQIALPAEPAQRRGANSATGRGRDGRKPAPKKISA